MIFELFIISLLIYYKQRVLGDRTKEILKEGK
ncbi:hypothetical protein LCGC14_0578680 [marine sediment metagenome]|uniref:Uncharacterized protein n=1 Tax=marine sediment metagenome TaxID=412755 RepID=A0A0F9UQD6_9ZZZZ